MKKALLAAAVFTTFIAGAIPVAQADPALVINPAGGCGLLDGNGAGAFTTDTKIVATQSQNGNTTLKCQADVTPASSGKAAQFDFASTGAVCGEFDAIHGSQVTQDWKETVSASGQATLICHFKS
jgi:hypothetical protein